MRDRSDLSRRDVIKRGLALGSVGYVAPMILGAPTTASAQTQSGSGCARASTNCQTDVVACSNQLSDDCACIPTVEGPLTCIQVGEGIDFNPSCCSSSSTCPEDWLCIDFSNLTCEDFPPNACDGPRRYCWPTCGVFPVQ